MKKKAKDSRLLKQLILNKQTITNLSNGDLDRIHGGWKVTDRTHCTCDLPCPTSPLYTDFC
jgi:hypothetical protein